jgi:phage terminase large subunit
MATKRKVANNFVLKYTPREAFKAFHQRTQRWAVLLCHRRTGKTVAAVHELVIRALYTTKHNPQYAYIAPFRSQAKKIAWKYLKDAVDGLAVEVRESDLMVTLPNGAEITLHGADNPDSLRGLYLDGVVIDEMADMRPSLWQEVILPALADRNGWAVVMGTAKGKGNKLFEFHDLAQTDQNWFSINVKASESRIIPDDELAILRAYMDEAQYMQEFENSFDAALVGAYYASTLKDVGERGGFKQFIPYDPNYPVLVAADIGYSDSTVMWFWQETPKGIKIIDCEAAHGQPLAYYFNMLRAKPYKYGKIWLPHDAKAKTLQTGKSTVEQFLDMRFPVDIVPSLSIQHGIDAVRLTLLECEFSLDKCGEGVEALKVYRRKYDERNRVYLDKPLHDWASDFADGFRYLSLVANRKALKPVPNAKAPAVAYGFTLDQLFSDRETTNKSPVAGMRV